MTSIHPLMNFSTLFFPLCSCITLYNQQEEYFQNISKTQIDNVNPESEIPYFTNNFQNTITT